MNVEMYVYIRFAAGVEVMTILNNVIVCAGVQSAWVITGDWDGVAYASTGNTTNTLSAIASVQGVAAISQYVVT